MEVTQSSVIDYYHSLDPWAPARFAVSWAGDDESPNWFHIAREYTERWHHQQQIREAVDKQGIMDEEFFSPLIQTFMMALPHAYRNTTATDGTVVNVKVLRPTNLEWNIIFEQGKWCFTSAAVSSPDTVIEMSGDTAWKLFTKVFSESPVQEKIKISGNKELGSPIIKMVSVMA